MGIGPVMVGGITTPDATRSAIASVAMGVMRAIGRPRLVTSTISPPSTRASTSAVCWLSTRIGICSMPLLYYSMYYAKRVVLEGRDWRSGRVE
jgi:hypothetical protein